MNSLNILSGIGATPPPSPSRSRAGSESDVSGTNTAAVPRSRAYTDDVFPKVTDFQSEKGGGAAAVADQWSSTSTNEKTPLLDQQEIETFGDSKRWGGWLVPKRIAIAVVGGLKAVLTVAVAPARYLASCFYDDNGHFSTLMPLYRIGRKFPRKKRRRTSIERIKVEGDATAEAAEDRLRRRSGSGKNIPRKSPKRSPSVSSTTSSVAITSDSESERPPTRDDDGPAKHTRSRSSLSAGDEIAPARRSIRIKLHNEDALRNRKQRKSRTASITKQSENGPTPQDAAVAALKSPTSPGPSSKLKFPRAPVPPRPLVPRRQPSYAANAPSQYGPHQKTLILDLDETLIHSMAKGGRYTTGHMVEVKLNQPVGAAGQIVGPQVPILYYVHKRPHCDDFLRKVSKWYNLVIFTASVQEYADPVIDWLELERKYFAGRFYRQHCTFRNGAYIKDLAQVEPDLSKVMIVDNSPMSYIFHEDNAIPIEGWISDPTDNDLLHLIPLLEGLQHVTDLRALLALRLGEPTAAA